MTQTRTGKGIGKEIGEIIWKVKDGTAITEKRVEAKRKEWKQRAG